MFGDDSTTPKAHKEQGVYDLPRYHTFAAVPSPYENGPAFAVVPRRGA